MSLSAIVTPSPALMLTVDELALVLLLLASCDELFDWLLSVWVWVMSPSSLPAAWFCSPALLCPAPCATDDSAAALDLMSLSAIVTSSSALMLTVPELAFVLLLLASCDELFDWLS